MNSLSATRRCVTKESIFIQTGYNPIIDEKPILRAHQTIATFTWFKI